MTDLPPDPTLDEIRAALAPLIAGHAAFDGWGAAALENAARDAGVDAVIAHLAFDTGKRGGGALAMIDAWFAHIDAMMLEQAGDLVSAGISARITALIETRLVLLSRSRDSLRRALATLAMPQNLATATKLGWRTADRIWRAAGDDAADFNHYTKRMTLSAVYAATILVFLDDESADFAETRAFLARRIAGIGRFEKAKARLAEKKDQRLSLSRFIGRLRYPAL